MGKCGNCWAVPTKYLTNREEKIYSIVEYSLIVSSLALNSYKN